MQQSESGTYSIREAAALMGVSAAYAYRLVRTEEFPVPVVRIGSLLRVRRSELDAFIAGEPESARRQCRVTGRPAPSERTASCR